MALLYVYSTNPWYSHEIATKYLNGKHFVWCSDCFDPTTSAAVSSSALTAPSSSPKGIFEKLYIDVKNEERNSDLIKRYKKTYRKLAAFWFASGVIDNDQKDEIIATVNSVSWRIWRPLLYIIYKAPIISSGRLKAVSANNRAGYGGEWQIQNLVDSEFEIIER